MKLFGDWDLKTRFTYKIKQITQKEAMQIAPEISKKQLAHRRDASDLVGDLLNLEESLLEAIGDQINAKIKRCEEIFSTFDINTASMMELQDELMKAEVTFCDPTFTPLQESVSVFTEPFPY